MSPYKRKGSVIYHLKKNRWSIKQRCRTITNAKKALRLLNGIEYGGLKPRRR